MSSLRIQAPLRLPSRRFTLTSTEWAMLDNELKVELLHLALEEAPRSPAFVRVSDTEVDFTPDLLPLHVHQRLRVKIQQAKFAARRKLFEEAMSGKRAGVTNNNNNNNNNKAPSAPPQVQPAPGVPVVCHQAPAAPPSCLPSSSSSTAARRRASSLVLDVGSPAVSASPAPVAGGSPVLSASKTHLLEAETEDEDEESLVDDVGSVGSSSRVAPPPMASPATSVAASHHKHFPASTSASSSRRTSASSGSASASASGSAAASASADASASASASTSAAAGSAPVSASASASAASSSRVSSASNKRPGASSPKKPAKSGFTSSTPKPRRSDTLGTTDSGRAELFLHDVRVKFNPTGKTFKSFVQEMDRLKKAGDDSEGFGIRKFDARPKYVLRKLVFSIMPAGSEARQAFVKELGIADRVSVQQRTCVKEDLCLILLAICERRPDLAKIPTTFCTRT